MNKVLFFLLLMLAAASCKDEEWSTPDAAPDPTDGYYFVLSNADAQAQTRVSYVNYQQAVFEEDDVVGIFAMVSDGNGGYTLAPDTQGNERYVVKNVGNIDTGVSKQVLEPASDIRPLPTGSEYTYLVYYPHEPGRTLEQMQNLTHTVSTSQNTAANGGNFKRSDLMWDVVTAENGVDHVKIEMEHTMATIVVEVDPNLILDETKTPEGGVVNLLNMPVTAYGMNLTKNERADLGYDVVTNDIEETETMKHPTDVDAWEFGLVRSGNRAFMATIPANHTITKGTSLLRIRTKDENGKIVPKVYKLKEDLELKPGVFYIFSFMNGGTTQPELNDDDSWVLDVVDPKTGNIVGLLCREYLRWQPEEGYKDTGTPTDDGSSKWINSQAWVFYNLQEGGRIIPDLNTGTVLRFIYDLDLRDNGSAPWPAPHEHKNMPGLFTPRHGMKWGKLNAFDTAGHGEEARGENGEFIEEQYWMHGGKITWNGTKNVIDKFKMPTDVDGAPLRITNKQAEDGYISINADGAASVSYNAPNEAIGERAALLIPHYLIDYRYSNSGGPVEVNKYPLVKIGYNQFWMSKSLNTTMLTNGTPLTCYNKSDSPGITFSIGQGSPRLSMGYIYAYVLKDNLGGVEDYDPYNKPYQMNPTLTEEEMKAGFTDNPYRPVPLYNRTAVINPLFMPVSEESQCDYIMPGAKEIEDMQTYFGEWYAAKILAKYLSKQAPNESGNVTFAYGMYTTCLRGETRGLNNDANAYTANISGFNLRAVGYYSPENGDILSVSHSPLLILKPEDDDVVTYYDVPAFDVWSQSGSGNANNYYQSKNFSGVSERITMLFGQVRFVLKYKNQADTGGSSGNTTRSSSTASSSQEDSRIVHIRLMEDE